MTAIALPERNILVPRLEFPAWLRHGRARASNMLAPLGGALSPLAVSGSVQNWWEAGGATGCLAAYQPKGAASLAASYVNLANPGTYDAYTGVAPTLGADGWTFNGSTQYLKSGIISVGTYSVLARISGSVGRPFGSYAYAAEYNIYIASGIYYANGTSSGLVTPAFSSGVVGIAGTRGYRNGTADGATLSGAGGGNEMFIAAMNAGGSPFSGQFFGGTMQALVIYNNTLDASMVAAVSAAMAAL